MCFLLQFTNVIFGRLGGRVGLWRDVQLSTCAMWCITFGPSIIITDAEQLKEQIRNLFNILKLHIWSINSIIVLFLCVSGVFSCFQVFQLFPGVSVVSRCFQLFPGVSVVSRCFSSFQFFSGVSMFFRCFQVFSGVFRCFRCFSHHVFINQMSVCSLGDNYWLGSFTDALSFSVMLSLATLSLRLGASSCQGSRRSMATVVSGNKTSKWVSPHPSFSIQARQDGTRIKHVWPLTFESWSRVCVWAGWWGRGWRWRWRRWRVSSRGSDPVWSSYRWELINS